LECEVFLDNAPKKKEKNKENKFLTHQSVFFLFIIFINNFLILFISDHATSAFARKSRSFFKRSLASAAQDTNAFPLSSGANFCCAHSDPDKCSRIHQQ